MDIGNFMAVGRAGIFEVLIVSAPVLSAAVGIGLIISILQAVTSIQEQTLTFVPKIFVILFMLVLLGPWMVTRIIAYTENIWSFLMRI